MDRVIKFRGKDKNGVQRYGSLLTDNTDWACIIDTLPNNEVDLNTVGQFTGFKDIGDKEIFEGDIIQNKVNPFEVYQVAIVNGCWSAINKVDCGVLHWFLENAPFKVIGNIHDNPELLEGGK